MTDDEDIETEDAKGLGARMVAFEKSMKDLPDATFADNVKLANDLDKVISERLYGDSKAPGTAMSLTEKVEMISVQVERLYEMLEEKLDRLIDRLG